MIDESTATIDAPEVPTTPTISPAMQKQVAIALACCAKVAKLYRRYGGGTSFVPWKTSGSAKIPGAPVKAPRSGFTIKRTIKGLR